MKSLSLFTRVGLGLLASALVLTFLVWSWFYSYWQRPAPSLAASPSQIAVSIPAGSSFSQIEVILADSGLIVADPRFSLIARYLGVAHKIRAGEFMLPTEQIPAKLLAALVAARPIQHSITLPEGRNIWQVATLLQQKGWVDAAHFLELVTDPQYIQSLGVDGLQSLEGYLYPDTYYLTADMKGAEQIIPLMVHRFFRVWDELAVDFVPDKYSRQELVTLASMVEKEVMRRAEAPIVAGVFYNRLQKGMRLQSDPTVVYGVERTSRSITRKDLRRKTPYNTYVIGGLPRGPICNPGADALAAVLHPETTKFLYFVSNNDGTHLFSTNLRDHNRAVRGYWRKVRAQRAKKARQAVAN